MPEDLARQSETAPPLAPPTAVPTSALLKQCDICGKPIPREAKKCTECDSAQNGKDCVVCGARMPLKARRCGQCESFQDWRRRIPGDQTTLALLAAILSILGTLGPQVLKFIDLRSQTTGFFLDIERPGAERHCITVRLVNDGGRPALAESARIDFVPEVKQQRRVQAADLAIVNRTAKGIQARKSSDLALYIRDLKFVGAPKLPPFADAAALDAANNAYKADVAQALCSTKTVLTVQVNERDWVNRVKPHPVTVELDKDAAQKWVLERMVGKNHPKVGCE